MGHYPWWCAGPKPEGKSRGHLPVRETLAWSHDKEHAVAFHLLHLLGSWWPACKTQEFNSFYYHVISSVCWVLSCCTFVPSFNDFKTSTRTKRLEKHTQVWRVIYWCWQLLSTARPLHLTIFAWSTFRIFHWYMLFIRNEKNVQLSLDFDPCLHWTTNGTKRENNFPCTYAPSMVTKIENYFTYLSEPARSTRLRWPNRILVIESRSHCNNTAASNQQHRQSSF